MSDTQQNLNEEFNNILIDILKELYSNLGPEDMSASLEVTLMFDEQQRIAKINNLLIDGLPKVPSFGLLEQLNLISTKLNQLPEKYKLKECKFSVASGGKMDIHPTYFIN